jgi:hypothetical protein
MWKRMILVLAVLLFALPAGAQTLTYGLSPTGTRIPVAVDAAGKVIISAAAALGLVQVAGVNGTTVATNANPLPVRPSADGTNPVDVTHPLPVRPSADGTNPVDATHPLAMRLSDGVALRTPPWARADDDDGANEVEIRSAAPVDYALPAAGWYDITASGNSACIICGAAPVAVMNTTCTIKVLEGVTRRLYLTGPVCSVIGPSLAGYVNFLYLNPAL